MTVALFNSISDATPAFQQPRTTAATQCATHAAVRAAGLRDARSALSDGLPLRFCGGAAGIGGGRRAWTTPLRLVAWALAVHAK